MAIYILIREQMMTRKAQEWKTDKQENTPSMRITRAETDQDKVEEDKKYKTDRTGNET